MSYRGLLCSIVNCRIGAGILFQYKGCLLYVQSMLTELAFGSLWKVHGESALCMMYLPTIGWMKYMTFMMNVSIFWLMHRLTRLNGQLTRVTIAGTKLCTISSHETKIKHTPRMHMERAAYDWTWRTTISFCTDEIRTAKELGQDQAHWHIAVLQVKVRTSDTTICIYAWYD